MSYKERRHNLSSFRGDFSVYLQHPECAKNIRVNPDEDPWEATKLLRNYSAQRLAPVLFTNTYNVVYDGRRGPLGLTKRKGEEVLSPEAFPHYPRGFFRSLKLARLISRINTTMLNTMQYDLAQGLRNIQQLPDSHEMKKIYKMLDHLTRINHNGEINRSHVNPVFDFMSGGLATDISALGYMVGTIDHQLKNKSHQPEQQEVAEILENSYPMAALLGSGHTDVHIPVLQGLKRQPYYRLDPHVFELQPHEGSYRLSIHGNKWNDLVDQQWQRLDTSYQRETTNCLGFANVEVMRDGQVVKSNHIIETMKWYGHILRNLPS